MRHSAMIDDGNRFPREERRVLSNFRKRSYQILLFEKSNTVIRAIAQLWVSYFLRIILKKRFQILINF